MVPNKVFLRRLIPYYTSVIDTIITRNDTSVIDNIKGIGLRYQIHNIAQYKI